MLFFSCFDVIWRRIKWEMRCRCSGSPLRDRKRYFYDQISHSHQQRGCRDFLFTPFTAKLLTHSLKAVSLCLSCHLLEVYGPQLQVSALLLLERLKPSPSERAVRATVLTTAPPWRTQQLNKLAESYTLKA